MWKSRAITVTLLSALTLTTCCISMSGCGRRAPDHTWYDANGNPIAEKWKTDANGNKLLDDQGRPIPDPHVPYDRYHHPWVFVNGAWAPPAPPAGSSSSTRSRSSGLWLLGGSGYRSTSSSPSYRTVTGGSGSSSSSSISRGGFGSTGSSGSS